MPYNLQIFSHSPTDNENALKCPKHNVNIIQFPDEELEGKQRQEKEKENQDFRLIVYIDNDLKKLGHIQPIREAFGRQESKKLN